MIRFLKNITEKIERSFEKKNSVGIEQMVLWIRIDDKTEDIVDT